MAFYPRPLPSFTSVILSAPESLDMLDHRRPANVKQTQGPYKRDQDPFMKTIDMRVHDEGDVHKSDFALSVAADEDELDYTEFVPIRSTARVKNRGPKKKCVLKTRISGLFLRLVTKLRCGPGKRRGRQALA